MPRVKIEDNQLVPIVGDGAIGDPRFSGGRLIPVLIVDCAKRPSLLDVVITHKDMPPGDVTTTWGWKLFSRKNVFLTFDFQQPVKTSATVSFDVHTQGSLVDWIMNSRGVYLQPSTSGSKVTQGIDKPKILVEVPPSASFPTWKKLYREVLEKSYRKHGLTRKGAKTATDEHLALMQGVQFRNFKSTSSAEDNPTGSEK